MANMQAMRNLHNNSSEVASSKNNNIYTVIQGMTLSVSQALPVSSNISADKFIRAIITETRKNPDLANAIQDSPDSFKIAIMNAAQLGLEIGSTLGQYYILPFKNYKSGKTEVQGIIGYQGMLDLARRSGDIKHIYAQEVYSDDVCNISLGLEPNLIHQPNIEGMRDRNSHKTFIVTENVDNQIVKKAYNVSCGNVRIIYAVVVYKDGSSQFEFMTVNDIEQARRRSAKGKNANIPSGAWSTDWVEMGKKTVIRRLFKWMRKSIELQKVFEIENEVSSGQNLTIKQDLTINKDDNHIVNEKNEVINTDTGEIYSNETSDSVNNNSENISLDNNINEYL